MSVNRQSIQRRNYDLGQKFLDLGNLLLVGMLISQTIPGAERYNWPFAVAGMLVFLMAYVLGYWLMKGGGQ